MTACKKFCIFALMILMMVLASCQDASPQAAAPTHTTGPSATAPVPPTPTATEKPTELPTATSTPEPEPTAAITSTPDAGYTDAALGFSLTLPDGWTVDASQESQVTFRDPTGAASLTVFELTTGEKLPMREAVRRMSASMPGVVIAFGDPFPAKMSQDVTFQEIDSSLTLGDQATIMRLLLGEVDRRTYIIYSLIPRDQVMAFDPVVGEMLKSLEFTSP